MDEKATIEYKQQNEQYTFPYHHIPHMDSWRGHSFPSMDRYLWFGFEYLGYNNRIIRMIKQRKLGSVLDVGCGDGKFLQMLSEEIMKSKHPEKMKMTGVDISAEAINLANSLNMYGGGSV